MKKKREQRLRGNLRKPRKSFKMNFSLSTKEKVKISRLKTNFKKKKKN